MQKTRISAVFLLLFAFFVSSARADRGLIPVTPGISVYEPGQKAIIAWNGHEEILILSTDLTSAEQTMILELLPLPSKPIVESASFQAFEQVQSLVWAEGTTLFGLTYNEVRDGSVEIIFREEIGTHNITVVKASDAVELLDWVGKFTKANQISQTVPLGDYGPIVEEYMNRGFRYYVLDLITVTTDERSHDAILYRFNSTFLYYPLVITSPVPGDTQITLFLLANGKIEADQDYFPLRKAVYNVPGRTRPIELVLSKGELSKIDLRIGELFTDMAWLTVMEYQGSPSIATTDLMITTEALTPDPTPESTVYITVDLSTPMALIALSVLVGAAVALAGALCTALIMRIKKTNTPD